MNGNGAEFLVPLLLFTLVWRPVVSRDDDYFSTIFSETEEPPEDGTDGTTIKSTSTKKSTTEPSGITTTTAATVLSGTTKRFINITYEATDRYALFSFNQTNFMFINQPVPYSLAISLCRSLGAKLAYIPSIHIAKYIAEALSESQYEYDTLWVAGELRGQNITTAVWKWHVWEESWEYEDIDPSLLDDLRVPEKALGVEDVDNLRRCMGFGRNFHLEPQFRPLSCTARRHVICHRPYDKITETSTHKGWIPIGPRLYKIFYDKTNYEDAEIYCTLAADSEDAKLAVIMSKHDAQVLGRYMLINRPSVETAWIGAKWIDGAYVFKAEKLVLKNATSPAGYPPWLGNRIRKSAGCVMLDRHLGNTSYFIESKCTTPRARICYKTAEQETHDTVDVIFQTWGYRAIALQMTWKESVDYCDRFKKYNGRLVEITEARQRVEMLYVMGENTTAIDHVWLGGKYNAENKWIWNYANEEVNQTLLEKWIRNSTYSHTVDDNYKCLNMDRENHVKSFFYGTICDYQQYFVCLFPTEDLQNLQEYEKTLKENQAYQIYATTQTTKPI